MTAQAIRAPADALIDRYIHEAVRFVPRANAAGEANAIRVAATLLTCGTAVAVLNEIGAPPEPESSYRHLNVHNPRCPIFFDLEKRRWSCARAFEDHPAWGLNWAGALAVCHKLGARLPSEQEWECFASNNEPSRLYPWGQAEPDERLANFGEHVGGTSAVRDFPPNDIGLYDLAGNLGEWCQDVFNATRDDGIATPATRSFERVVKGGAWSKDARHLRIASRRGKWQRLGTTTIGLRPVWDKD